MPQINRSKKQWDNEYASGKWDYLDSTPSERARSAIMGMYCRYYSPEGKILDVGCGHGTLADFLNPAQKRKYLGIDISAKAVEAAKKKGVSAKNCDFQKFDSTTKYDMVVFNEVLYYMDEKAALKRGAAILKKKGTVIISLYRMKNKRYDRGIWRIASRIFRPIDVIEVSGIAKGRPVIWRVQISEKR